MKEVLISDDKLRQAAANGNDAFVCAVADSINDSIVGGLTAENMAELGSDQITLLAYRTLRDEVMDGGFIELIHDGYGAFMFRNPLGKALREWGLRDLYKIIDKTHSLYTEFHDEIERECTDEEFMAMYEKYPKFDKFDDEFVDNEEVWTGYIARYVDEHISNFVKVVNDE